MKTYFRYSFVAIFCLVPFFASAVTVYQPRNVQNIFIDEQATAKTYEVLVMLDSGRLYRLDTVTYDGTRYRLFEDISQIINNHKSFTNFDDEDIAELIWGIAPFSVSEVTGIETRFTEQEVDVILSFGTGDTAWYSQELGETRFSSSVEVTQYITDIINAAEELEGEITTAQVVTLHDEPYTGLSYFAPQIDGVVATYDSEEESFGVEVTFGNSEVRNFTLGFKDTKEQLIQDITASINELYVEYEDARFEVAEVEPLVTWKKLPWMIDDIESIEVAKDVSMDGTLEFTVRTRLSNDLVGVIKLNKVFSGDEHNTEVVAIAAVEALEENELFVHDFNVSLVQRIIIDSIPEEDQDEYDTHTSESSSETDTTEESPVEDTLEESVDTDETAEEAAADTDEVSSPASEQEMIDLLVAIIIQYVLENGLDVDLSVLTS